jgi:hypothetical protein
MTTFKLETLANNIEAFLEFKRTLGYPYVGGEFTLRSCLRFVRH